MAVGLAFLTSCTQPNLTLEGDNPYQSIMVYEGFHEFRDLPEGFTSVEDKHMVPNQKELVRVKKGIERIPSFQANEFHSIQTNNRSKVKKKIEVNGGDVKINVESIPLNEFVDFIFSSVLKVNYTIDKSVKKMKQPITLNMAKTLPKQQVLAVVKNILKKESVIFTQKDGIIFISKASVKQLKEGLSDTYMFFGRELSSKIKDDQKVMAFVPFYYTQPDDLRKLSRYLRIENVKINFLNKNIAILRGTAFAVKELLELVKIVDSPDMENKVPYLLELEYVEVKKFTEQMKTILKNNAIPIANNIREVGMVLTPIEEINALLVISSKESWIDMLKFWKKKLDVLSKVDEENSQLYIYKVKYRKADELAEVLQDLLSMKISKTKENKSSNSIHQSENNQSKGEEGMLGNDIAEVNIKSDLHTNSIMMNVTPSVYQKILPIIKKMDTLPLQVEVEVILAEVDLTDTFNLGFEWSLLNNKAISGTSTRVSGAYTLGLGGGGVTSTLFTKNLTSVINAFAEKKKLEILSRPRLVILNNQSGNINVGQQVPVVNSEASATDLGNSGGSPNILRNISYTSTGMTLSLTPTINSNGTLTLNISVSLSEAQANKTSNIDSPLIVNRSLSTSAVMQSGNTLLLGGIISQKKSSSHGGVPSLQDVAFIGDIFKSRSSADVKTELIIMIKPTILKNIKELSDETEKFKSILTNLQKSTFL